jgi:hypothetical protein
MRHARPDYERFQDPAGLIPENEPVFIIRAKDRVSGDAVRAWANLAEADGAAENIVEAARNHARAMDAWPVKQIPDMPGPANETPQQVIARLTRERDAWKARAAKHGCNVVDGDPDCG